MHIAFSADDNYAQHLGVAIASILKNLKIGIIPHIHVLENGISKQNKDKLEQLKQIRDFSISYLLVDMEEIQRYPLMPGYNSHTTYFRLKLPAMLPEVEKIIYLDVDIIVRDDLSPLWEIEMDKDNWISAVLEPVVHSKQSRTIITEPKEPGYFNAGIMVMNLAALRGFDFEEKCLDFVKHFKHKMQYVDQDILNDVCRNHVIPLDPRYNFMPVFLEPKTAEEITSIYPWQQIKQAVKTPAIVHFIGRRKAWLYKCNNNYGSEYMKYIQYTPWKNYRYPDYNIKTVFSRYLYRIKKLWAEKLWLRPTTRSTENLAG